MSVRHAIRGAVLGIAAILVVGCNAILDNASEYHLVGAAKDAGTATCTLNSECAKGQICIFKTCSPPCHEDVDCDPGFRCLDTADGTACVSAGQAKCAGGACPSGTTCTGSTCRTTCGEGGGCRNDQTCTDGACFGTDSSHDLPQGAGGAGGRGGAGGTPGTGGGGGHDAGMTDSGSGGRGGAPVDSGNPDTGAGGEDAGADPCVGIACDKPPVSECTDTTTERTYAKVGSCSGGTCTYAPTDTSCGFGCTGGKCDADPCIGIACGTPPPNVCQDAGHLTAYNTTGTCAAGTCNYSKQTITCTCVADACTTDPCATITCNSAPSPTCYDASTRRAFTAPGTCSNGSCTYGHTDTNCPFGCSGGVCSPDPCATVTCDSPPSNSCPTGTTVRKYSASGTCAGAGVCTYGHTDTNCPFGCANAACKADPCASMTCNSPPANGCTSNTNLLTYSSGGFCTNGTCSYQQTNTTCVNQTCVGAACTGVCAPGQTKCSGNGVQSCTSSGTWGTAAPCTNQACVTGVCTGVCTPNATPTQCFDANTPQFCNTSGLWQQAADCSGTKSYCQNGGCVGCTAANQCPSSDCTTATCTTNTCGSTSKVEGTPCTGGIGYVCDGAGSCSECTLAYHNNCTSTEVCRSSLCINAVHNVGWDTATSSQSNPAAGTLYLMKMPLLAHDALLTAFGLVGTGTGATYKLALYIDDGSGTGPSAGGLLAYTVSGIATANGAVETTSFTPANVTLYAGVGYWLAFKSNVQVFIKAAANPSQIGWSGANAFSSAFPPDPMGTLAIASENGTSYAVYLRVQDTD